MAAHREGSWLVLDEAIGPNRHALADLLGCSVDRLDLQCSPPADFTPQGRANRGRRNWLDEAYHSARSCPNGLSAVKWLCQQLGGRFVYNAATPHAGNLLVEPTMLAAAVDTLLRELDRRKPKMPDAQVAQIADTIADDLTALVADRLESRRRKATK